jgi:hypothetical protein
MAKPFFTGDYGSALAKVDTRPIVEAGRAQGQMFANLGSQIGGMIKQYGLNKEKRQKEEDTAMGNLANFSPEDLLTLETTNPKLGQALKRATTDQATPRDFQLINSASAPFIAKKARDLDNRYKEATIKGKEFENKFNLANEKNKLLESNLENQARSQVLGLNDLRAEGARLDNELKKLNTVSKGTENQYQRTQIQQQIEQNRLGIKSAEEGIKKQITDNKYSVPMYESQLLQKQLAVGEIAQRMEKNAMEMDQLRADETLDREIKEERLAGMQADREKIEAELNTAKQSAENLAKLIQRTDPSKIEVSDDELIIPSVVGGGDIGGVLKDITSTFFGLIGSESPDIGGSGISPKVRAEQKVKIKGINTTLRPMLVGAVSARGNVYTQKQVDDFLIQPSDNDETVRNKLIELPKILKDSLTGAVQTISQPDLNKGSTNYIKAQQIINTAPKMIAVLSQSLGNTGNNQTSGEELTDDELIDDILK